MELTFILEMRAAACLTGLTRHGNDEINLPLAWR
jgi:hypothetical protein